MAIDSKSSFSNPNGFDLTDEAFDQSNIHSPSANFRSASLIGTVNGLISSQPLSPSPTPSPSPTTSLLPPTNLLQTNQHQTLPVGPRSGQLAFTSELRAPYLGLPRVHVQTLVDRHPCNHPGLTEISVTEIKTTGIFTPTSVADHFLQPSGISSARGYDDVYQVSNATANRLMLAMATRYDDNPYNYMRNIPQTQSIIPSQQFLNPMPDIDGPSLTGQALVQKFDLNEVPSGDDQSLPLAPRELLNAKAVSAYVPNDRRDQQKPDEAAGGHRPGMRVHAHSNQVNGEPSQPAGGVDESDHNVVGRDGRTHSLPSRKYGPYKCRWPRCRRVLPTSQQFATHTVSHYSRETAAQRKRRRMERNRNVRLRASHHIAHGFSVWPKEAVGTLQRQRRREIVNIEAEESEGENDPEMQLVVRDDATSSAVGESSLGVKIKQETEEQEFSSTN
ncbi:hypothetical protein SLA2020_482200 [Shorea laevis]